MPVLNKLIDRYSGDKPFAGIKMAVCIHLEAKSAYMAKAFKACGAEVVITGSNPLSTQDAIAAALVEDGIEVFAWHGATADEYNAHIRSTIDSGPQLIIDDGGRPGYHDAPGSAGSASCSYRRRRRDNDGFDSPARHGC